MEEKATNEGESQMLEGGCFCGAIRYEVSGTGYETCNCHCSMCRRASGAPFVAWFVVPKSECKVVSGTFKELRSSEHGIRGFCADCGTPVTCELDTDPEVIDVTTCSLDDPEQLPSKTDVHTDTQLSWIRLSHVS